MTTPAGQIPVSQSIHYLWLDTAYDLLTAAGQLAADPSPDAQARTRARCAASEVLACAALEGWANVFAPLHYARLRAQDPSLPPWGKHARDTGWRGKTTAEKWREIAQVLPAGCLDAVHRTWAVQIGAIAKRRNELIHFDTAFGRRGVEPMYRALCPEQTASVLTLARGLINACHSGYEAKYGLCFTYGPEPATTTDEPPRAPWIWPAAVPPIGTAASQLTIRNMPPPEPAGD